MKYLTSPSGRKLIAAIAVIATAATLGAGNASAAKKKLELRRLGTFQAWSSYTLLGGKSQVCYMHSEPKKMAGEYTQRGASFLQITHRPQEKIANEVGLTAGYSYRKESEVVLEIDGKTTFKLFTNGDGAWARDAKTDAQVVGAMSRGSEMVVHGVSGRGTKTTDNYSLSGFTAAYRSIGKACKVK